MHIDALGRRRVLLCVTPALALALAALAAALSPAARARAPAQAGLAAAVAATLYSSLFSVSLGPLPNMLTSELLPTRARGQAMAVLMGVNNAANVAVTALFPVLQARFGTSATLLAYSAVCPATRRRPRAAARPAGAHATRRGQLMALASLFFWRAVPETKGQTLEQAPPAHPPAHPPSRPTRVKTCAQRPAPRAVGGALGGAGPIARGVRPRAGGGDSTRGAECRWRERLHSTLNPSVE